MKVTLEGIGGLATAVALVVSIVTFAMAYNAQERFNVKQLEYGAKQIEYNTKQIEYNTAQLQFNKEQSENNAKQLRLMTEANNAALKAAQAQREASAVEALGKYLEAAPSENRAWAAAEAIIDMVGEDEAWQATARRALRTNTGNLSKIECELYSKPFVEFAAKTFNSTVADLCAHRAVASVAKSSP